MNYQYDAKTIKARVNALFDEKGIKAYKVMPSLGLAERTVDPSNISMPKADTLARIADYLDVSVDMLLGRTSHGLGLTRDELTLLNLFRGLSDEYRSELLHYAEYVTSKNTDDEAKKEATLP